MISGSILRASFRKSIKNLDHSSCSRIHLHSHAHEFICILNKDDEYMILSEEVKLLGSQKVLDSTPASRCFVASNDGDGYFVGLVHYKLGCGCQLVRYRYLGDLEGPSIHILGPAIVVDWFHA